MMKRIAVLAATAALAVAGFAPAAQAATHGGTSSDACIQIFLIPLC